MTSGGAVLDALGDGTRRAVFELIANGPTSVTEVAELLPVSRPAVSQHLRVLQDAGLVRVRAAGRRRIYSLDPAGLDAARAYFTRFWTAALASFAQAADAEAEAGDHSHDRTELQEET